MRQLKRYIPFVVCLLFFVVSLFTLPEYGSNSDSSQHFTRGQMFLRYFITGKKLTNNFLSSCAWSSDKKHNTCDYGLYRPSIYDYMYPWEWAQRMTFGHPAFNDLLMAISNKVFYGYLHVIDDVRAYHIVPVTLTFFMALVIALWIQELYGSFASTISVLALYSYPLLFSEQHFNLKDPSIASFYTVALYLFWRALTKNSKKLMLLSSLVFAIGFSTKFNIIFLPIVLLPWVIFFFVSKLKKVTFLSLLRSFRPWIIFFCLFPILGLILLYGSWPVLWDAPIHRFFQVIAYYRSIGSPQCIYPVLTPQWWMFCSDTFPTTYLMFGTPFVTIIFFLFGIIYAAKNLARHKYIHILWGSFFVITLLRVTLPITSTYGGRIRHILEIVAPSALFAGVGAYWVRELLLSLIKTIRLRVINRVNLNLLLLIFYIPIGLTLYRLHPNENVYFNPLIGGLSGAAAHHFRDVEDTYGNVYYQGMIWLNKYAEKNAFVDHPVDVIQSIAPTFIRSDLHYYPSFSGFQQDGEYLIQQVFPSTDLNRYFRYDFAKRFLKPIHVVSVDGVPLLYIWKNDPEHTLSTIHLSKEKEANYTLFYDMNELTLSFDDTVVLKRIEFRTNEPQCKAMLDGYYVLTSPDGHTFSRMFEDARSFSDLTGIYDANSVYLFAGEQTKYLKIYFYSNPGCDLKTVQIKVFQLVNS